MAFIWKYFPGWRPESINNVCVFIRNRVADQMKKQMTSYQKKRFNVSRPTKNRWTISEANYAMFYVNVLLICRCVIPNCVISQVILLVCEQYLVTNTKTMTCKWRRTKNLSVFARKVNSVSWRGKWYLGE